MRARCPYHLAVQLCSQRKRGFASAAAGKLFIADETKKHIVFDPAARPTFSGNVSAITGPSRQGKSHLANLLVKSKAFKTSSNPVEACTFGAWVSASSEKGLILDTEGASHQVTESTKKLFCACYPLVNNFVFSSKELGADSFLKMMDELKNVMMPYQGSAQERKPRLFIVLRDAESFGFEHTNGEYKWKGEDGKYLTCHELCKSLEDNLKGYKLFSSIDFVALPSLKDFDASNLDKAGASVKVLEKMLENLNSEHAGPLCDIKNDGMVQTLVDTVNNTGCFDPQYIARKLMEEVGTFEAQLAQGESGKHELAAMFDWDAERMKACFKDRKKNLEEFKISFPQQASFVIETLTRLDKKVNDLYSRMANKKPITESKTEEVVSHEEVVCTLDKGAYTGVGVTTGILVGACGGAGLGGAGLVAGAVVCPPFAIAAAAGCAALGGLAGGGVGHHVRSTEQTTSKIPKVVKTTREEHKGYKLGPDTASS
eukprot:TRINITY_DN70837_c0_g1_i1.p1 TRINITY_DN70837_c0_g1~~TRINITY_DN70837_c0_g1_i1.p1  ORF type:complete len:485 (+),score=68.01 TRINITY_DN70837_c0_g1_i1:67-1521(+)